MDTGVSRSATLAPYRAARRVAGTPAPAAAATRWSWDWIYFSAIILAWSFTPLVRRLIDFRNGAFNPVQFTSVIPFLLVAPLVLLVFSRPHFARLSPILRVAVWVWSATFAYGLLVAAGAGGFGAGAFELVQNVVPMGAGLWLASQELPAAQAFRRLCRVLLPCGAVVALYGIYQWISPPPWDVMWVDGLDFYIVGETVPFAMRIFSTLNAPGPAGDFFACCIIFAMPFVRLRNAWVWPLLAVLSGGLLLTLTREAWIVLVVGLAAYLIASPRRSAVFPLLGGAALVVGLLVLGLPAIVGSNPNPDAITQRFSTFGDIGNDESALERQEETNSALAEGLANPLGAGLGVYGTAAKLGAGSDAVGNILDGGYLVRFIELGWLGMAAYLVVVIAVPLALANELIRRSGIDVDAKVVGAAALAVCAALAWGDVADDAHLGLDGFLFWVALGLGSLAAQSAATAAEPRARFAGARRAR